MKTRVAVSTVIRSTSCSRGWLRLVVQVAFGFITVTSFIMILVMALQRKPEVDRTPVERRRCMSSACKVVCSNAPFYDDFVNDVKDAIAESEYNCITGISLTLNRPAFMNYTLPKYWFSQVTALIHEVVFIGGNLRYIQPDSFMTYFGKNIRNLVFEDLVLDDIESHSFIGLTNLDKLNFVECRIKNIHKNAMRPVKYTLKTLHVTNCGRWNPANLTGSSELKKLITVDFSCNEFGNILGRESFNQLQQCEELDLSSSRLISLGSGAFDAMLRLRRLYLNNNYLVSLPLSIFDKVITLPIDTKLNIALHNNLWRCDCYTDHLRLLQKNDYLMVDPICDTPYNIKGKYFSSFDTFCCNYEQKNSRNDSMMERKKEISDNKNVYHNSLSIDASCQDQKVNTNKCMMSKGYRLGHEILQNISRYANKNSAQFELSYYVESYQISLLEIRSVTCSDYHLLWFHSSGLSDIYCIDIIPSYLRIYNINQTANYVFCAIEYVTGELAINSCISYTPPLSKDVSPIPHPESDKSLSRGALAYAIIVTLSLLIGASCLYAIILINPKLLRGSKRVLLVKHKTVDALILPPKVPERNDNLIRSKIMVPNVSVNVINNFIKSNSMRSSKSSAPSYISAMLPTDAQLKEWRLNQHFHNNHDYKTMSYIQPVSLESQFISYIYDGDTTFYSLDPNKAINDNDDNIQTN